MCEIQDDRHEADEDKVGASDNAQKECSLSKFSTAQDHLEEHLKTDGEERRERTKSAPPQQRDVAEGCTCQVLAMSLAQGGCCLFITLGSTDSRPEETRSPSKYSYLSRSLLDRDTAARGRRPEAQISHASIGLRLHFIISSGLLPPGCTSKRELDFLYKTGLFTFAFFFLLYYLQMNDKGGLWKPTGSVMFSTIDQMQTSTL